jgi:hypothetical protein
VRRGWLDAVATADSRASRRGNGTPRRFAAVNADLSWFRLSLNAAPAGCLPAFPQHEEQRQ